MESNSNSDQTLHILPDYIKDDLDIIVIGLNPSLTSAQIGHYFAGPGNHFWSCMSEVGLVPEPVTCYDDSRMMEYGIGFLNACSRPTKGAADLSKKELKDGMKMLLSKLQRFNPKIVVFNGKGTYEIFIRHKHFGMGKQPNRLEGTNSVIFVMPSSSARCAQLPRAADKIPFFSALKELRDRLRTSTSPSNASSNSSFSTTTPDQSAPSSNSPSNQLVIPDHIDLELTRLYDAGKSNYSSDKSEKKRKHNNNNNNNNNSQQSHNGTMNGRNNGEENSRSSTNSNSEKPPKSSKKDEPPPSPWLPSQSPQYPPFRNIPTGPFIPPTPNNHPNPFYSNMLLPPPPPPHHQPLPHHHHPNPYNSNMHYAQPTHFKPHNFYHYPHQSPTHPHLLPFHNNQNNEKTDSTITTTKDEYNQNTNFVSLLMSDNISPSQSPNLENNNNIKLDFFHNPIPQTTATVPPSFYPNPLFNLSNRRFLSPSDTCNSSSLSLFNNFTTNNSHNFDTSIINYSPTSTINNIQVTNDYANYSLFHNTINSNPLSSDQVTSSLCSVKVTPDSTSIANRKRAMLESIQSTTNVTLDPNNNSINNNNNNNCTTSNDNNIPNNTSIIEEVTYTDL